jgi:hypothetical protein
MVDTLHYDEDLVEQEKLFVGLLGDANINSEAMVSRYRNVRDIVESSVDIGVL